MKTILMLAIALTAISTSFAESKAPKKSRQQILDAISKMTPQERAARFAARRAEAERNLGGFLEFPATGNVVRVINRQKLIAQNDVELLSKEICNTIGMAIEVVAPDAPANPKEAARINLVEDGSATVLLIAPEDKFGTLNLARLNADQPDETLLSQRFAKEYWRVIGMTLGSFNSDLSPCVMRNIFSLKDLDKDPSACPSPVVFDKIQSTCRQLGITRPRRISYRRACIEGIAPSPTNAIQKAVWDKVHELPAEPLKIKPETKKVTE